MGTDVAAVIAYRDMGCEFRRASFAYVKAWYETLGAQVVVESGTDDATFTRASAINAAIRRTDARVIIQADPDSLVPADTLAGAIAKALTSQALVIPHSQYLYLDPESTMEVLTGELQLDQVGPEDCEEHGLGGSGNVVVFLRDAWADAGGFDERFGLWGGDDAAFRYTVEALRGPARRLEGPVVHLWHPRLPQSAPGHPLYVEQFALLAQYRDAAAISPQAVLDVRGIRP